eukprot:18333-Heterococcus_DN1.PRE.2
MAKIEMSLYTDLFDKMSDICFKKCISSVHDADLSVGEMSCTDRCVVKYLKAQEVVGVRMKGAEEQNMQQSAQAEKMLSKDNGHAAMCEAVTTTVTRSRKPPCDVSYRAAHQQHN